MTPRQFSGLFLCLASAMATSSSPSRAALAVANMLEEEQHIGVAYGPTAAAAEAAAKNACAATGGSVSACQTYAIFVRGHAGPTMMCLAGAQGANGDFGYGLGGSKAAAASAAIANCHDHSSGNPKVCKQYGNIACQPNTFLK